MTSERKSGRARALVDAEEASKRRKETRTKKGKGKEWWKARRKIVKALMMILKQLAETEILDCIEVEMQ
jgi:hypothetical protein